MADYLLIHDRRRFEEELRAPLGEARRRRSFRACEDHVAAWRESALGYARQSHIDPDELFLVGFSPETAFVPLLWRTLVGELLVVTAVEMPELPGSLDALVRLLGGPAQRPDTAPLTDQPAIRQALHGSRDLTFGLVTYRPGRAGFNSAHDTRRIHDFLKSVEPAAWSAADLAADPPQMDAAEVVEELDYLRHWFGVLLDVYERAAHGDRVVVFEQGHA